MNRILTACVLAGILSAAFMANAEPTAPDQVQPLLIGSPLPDVAITNLDGESVSLADVILGSPTLLIFYRGGW
jgi:hypothetical protein